MIFTIVSTTILAMVLVALQTSALPAVMLSALLLLPLAALIAFLLRAGPHWSWIFAISAGLMLDCVSPMPFGTHLIAFFVVVTVVVLLQERFFTNRSWPVVILLSAIASLLYWCIIRIVHMLTVWLHGTLYSAPLIWTTLLQIPITILCTILFILLGTTMRKFFENTFFLRSSRPTVR